MEPEDLICALIASWVALPAAGCFFLSLHYIVEIKNTLLFIIIGVLSTGSLIVAIFVTISFKFAKFGFYFIAFYISLVLSILSILFTFGYFIGGAIYFFKHFSELGFFSSAFKLIGVVMPIAIFGAMHLNVVEAKKELTKGNEEEPNDNA